jgi:hypothetical protein
MTVLIGIKAVDGAVLLADALRHDKHNTLAYKIRDIIHSDADLSALYLAHAGRTNEAIISTSNFFTLARRDPTILDDFLDEQTLSKDLNQWMDELEHINPGEDPIPTTQKTFHGSYAEATRRYIMRTLTCIESGRWEYIGLRVTQKNGIGLYTIEKDTVTGVNTYATQGSGAQIVTPTLEAGYQEGMTIDQAIWLGMEAMNVALEQPRDFKGYAIVVAKKEEGEHTIRTAHDLDATEIRDPVWEGPRGLP